MRVLSAVFLTVVAGVLAFVATSGITAGSAASIGAGTSVGVGTAEPVARASVGPDLGPLTAMIEPLKTTSHNVAMKTAGSNMTGAVNQAQRSAAAVVYGGGVVLSEVVHDGRIYLKADLGSKLNQQVGIDRDVWMAVDPAKLDRNNAMLVQSDGSDPIDLPGIAAGVTTLTVIDKTHLRGTLNLTKVTGHTLPDPQAVAKDGKPALEVPFTATADAQGRIINFHVIADSFDPSLTLNVTYSGYGAPAKITVPKSSVPAPAAVYTLFNG